MSVEKQLEQNKALVARLIEDLFFTQPPRFETINELVHESYIQHNPAAGQGREGLREFVQNAMVNATPATLKMHASKRVTVNLIAEGDFVVRQEVREDWMLVDIFRCRDGWLVEHWDALRTGPELGPIPGF